jgi:hypothetical protein
LVAEQQTLKMVEEDKAIILSEDEERLLKAYRQFVAASMPGSTFAWITPEDDTKIMLPETPSIIQDPRLVIG